jgi:predicted Holliday junction resolvase-like endonuclease
MNKNLASFFELQRHIFGICPKCGNFFRLSDAKIFSKKKPIPDWMDNIDIVKLRLDKRKEDILAQKKKLQEEASARGRRLAQLMVKKIDPVFTPRKLHSDDAKVILHPIDYVVFNGMNTADSIKNIVLLDKKTNQEKHKKIQKSIERVVERNNYDWVTIRIQKDGAIDLER